MLVLMFGKWERNMYNKFKAAIVTLFVASMVVSGFLAFCGNMYAGAYFAFTGTLVFLGWLVKEVYQAALHHFNKTSDDKA